MRARPINLETPISGSRYTNNAFRPEPQDQWVTCFRKSLIVNLSSLDEGCSFPFIRMKEDKKLPKLLFFVRLIVMGLLMACLLVLGERSPYRKALF